MKRSLLLALAFAVSISVASAENLKAKINKVNAAVARAFMHNDMAAFEKVTRDAVTSDFKHIDMGHTQNYDEMLAEMKQSLGMMKITACSAKTSHIKIHGKTATSVTNHRMMGKMSGPDKKNHRMAMSGTTHDKYRMEDGKWKLAEMKWSNEKMTMDGKPFDPSKMMGGTQGGH